MQAKQAYVCFKYTFKRVLRSLRPHDVDLTINGRSQVGSYHLKTVFLRHLEQYPPQEHISPFQLMLELCQDLKQYLTTACLPHYFQPACNLLQTVGDEERQYALKAVVQVIADPMMAIMGSPSEPEAIYGVFTPFDIIRCFRNGWLMPFCASRFADLQQLLRRLDEHRKGLHQRQLKKDGRHPKVSGRPRLVSLSSMIQSNQWLWPCTT